MYTADGWSLITDCLYNIISTRSETLGGGLAKGSWRLEAVSQCMGSVDMGH